MKILQTSTFYKTIKKLKKNQKKILDSVVRTIADKPLIGERKTGDLKGVYVYKFSMTKQQILLAYTYKKDTLILLAFGSRENFYRNLKKSSLRIKN